MMRFLPATAKHAAADEGDGAVRRLQVQEPGFQFYKHPPAEAYGLNRLLFEVRHSGELRDRVIANLDSVAKSTT
jgi:hypothetical protein